MRILSSSDWHLGAGIDDDVDLSVRQIVEAARYGKVDLVVLAGDLFDRKSEPEARNRLAALLRDLADQARLVVVYGNHDAPGDLEIMGRLKAAYQIRVLDRPETVVAPAGRTDVCVHFLPWLPKSWWAAANPQASIQEADRSVSAMALAWLRAERAIYGAAKHILVGHLTISGAKAENHQPLIGRGVELGAGDLADLGLCGAILGHIHLRQEFNDGTVFYNGSPCAQDYGESSRDKWFSVLDTESGEVEWHRIECVDRYLVDAEWLDGGFVFAGLEEGRAKGARVRVRYRLPEGEDAVRARAALAEAPCLAGALEIKADPQIVPAELFRSHAYLQAVAGPTNALPTMAQRLDAYWEATGARPPEPLGEGVRSKLGQIEAAEGAAGLI